MKVGDDIQALGSEAPIHYPVQNVYEFPYNLLDDVGLVYLKFGEVTDDTPTIPFLQPGEDEGLEAGMDVILVGYASNDPNPAIPHFVRLRTTKKLLGVTPYQLLIDQGESGACKDDLGGPVLVDVGGTLKVAGILTRVEKNCAGAAVAIRTAPLMGHYFRNVEHGENNPPAPCGYCRAVRGDGTCKHVRTACDAVPACTSLEACLNGCTSRACVEKCQQDFAAGVAALEVLRACVCDACDYECLGAVECGGDFPEPGGEGGAGSETPGGGDGSSGAATGDAGSPATEPEGGAPSSGGSSSGGSTAGGSKASGGDSTMPSAGSGGSTSGGSTSKSTKKKKDDDGCSVSMGSRPSSFAGGLALLALGLLIRRQRARS